MNKKTEKGFFKSLWAKYSDDDEFSTNNLNKLSYDELIMLHKNVVVNSEKYGEKTVPILQSINRVLEGKVNPRQVYAKALSDEEIDSAINNITENYYEKAKAYKRNKRPMSELLNDPDYKAFEEEGDTLNQLQTEKQRRYAKANPDKFPRHREHGFNLYKKNDDN